ncbi:peroxisomal enoyl-CoA-hydratase [Peniophora sp. CONT]|nr:peroxisomal enoyl-CoA-hydratase [Peniophora sp. CONT]
MANLAAPIDYAQGFKDLYVTLDGAVAIVTINRPAQRNTFAGHLPLEIIEVFRLLDLDDRIRVVILTADPKAPAFCSGADLSGGWKLFADQPVVEVEGLKAYRDRGGSVSLAIHKCRKITIAAVNGHAVGVGVTGFQLPFDFRLIWEGAKLALPFTRRGISPEASSTYFLPRLLGHSRASALLLTGGTFSPKSPLLDGLYYSVHPTREEVFPAALSLAKDLAENTSATSVAATKALLWRGSDSPEGQHLLDSRSLGELAKLTDANEGAVAFKERRKPVFKDTIGDMKGWYPWWTPLQVAIERSKL